MGRKCYLEDDDAYYSKDSPYRLLCPHGWKRYRDKKRHEGGETEGDQANFFINDDYSYLLTWDRGKRQRTVYLSDQTNLPTIPGQPTYEGFCTFAAAFKSFPTLIPDDGDEESVQETMQMSDEEPIVAAAKERERLVTFSDEKKPP